jgi:alanine racemase
MARSGVWYTEAVELARRISGMAGVRIRGISTHFACADDPDSQLTSVQTLRFRGVLEALAGMEVRPLLVHVANSAALLSQGGPRFAAVRPGLILYGVPPAPHLRGIADFRPALTWKTRIIGLRRIDAGQGVSYGLTFSATRPSTVATISVGYADGYRWQLSNRGKVIIRGREARVIGRVCMDLTMCDVTEIADTKVGDEVTLIGRENGIEISAEDLAEISGLIPYDILTGIGERVRRTYRD